MLPEPFLARPIAHRALHGAGRPENSGAAIRAAIEAGYGVEIDLQLSADGQAMVFHDYGLSRLTGQDGPVKQRKAAELGAIALIGGAEGIATLAEVLDLVRGRVPVLIELKDQHGDMGPTDGALEGATADALTAYKGPVAVMSFNPEMVARMAQLSPQVPRGLTTSGFDAKDWPTLSQATRDRLRDMPDVHRVGASFISHDHRDLASPAVAQTALPKLCWTIRTPIEAAKALQIADNITFEGFAA